MPESYLYARCASDMAVLYWDKPSLAAADAVYTVFVNDKKLADTKKTHCTIWVGIGSAGALCIPTGKSTAST